MRRPDDYTLPSEELGEVRRYALRLLKEADAYGRFPTPARDIVRAAKLTVDREVSLDQGFLHRIYKGVTRPILRAVDKVLGLLDVRDKRIYLDSSVHPKKQVFLSIHETGHDYLPWQRDVYLLIEDDARSLDPGVKDLFERQANVFAAEVLFQLDLFKKEAADYPFTIQTPVDLSRRYGTSCYAAARRYTQTHHKACALLVLDGPIYEVGRGNTLTLRRSFQSPAFTQIFGEANWPDNYGPDHLFLLELPRAYSFSETRPCRLGRAHGAPKRCSLEIFNSGYNVFVFIYPESERKLTSLAN